MKHQDDCFLPKPVKFCIPEKFRCFVCVPHIEWCCFEKECDCKEDRDDCHGFCREEHRKCFCEDKHRKFCCEKDWDD